MYRAPTGERAGLGNLFCFEGLGGGVEGQAGDGALGVFVEGEGDVTGEDEELGGGFGKEFDGVGAEGFGCYVKAGWLRCDG